MSEKSWRQMARKTLRSYPILQKKRASGMELTIQERDAINAVEIAIGLQGDHADRLRVMQLVYFEKKRTLEGAALECGYSVDAAHRWNAEILTAVMAALAGMRVYE